MSEGINFRRKNSGRSNDVQARSNHRKRRAIVEVRRPAAYKAAKPTLEDNLHRMYREQEYLVKKAKLQEELEKIKRAHRRRQLKSKALNNIKSLKHRRISREKLRTLRNKARERKRFLMILIVLVLIIILPFVVSRMRKKSVNVTGVQGANTGQGLPQENPDYSIFYPSEIPSDKYSVVRVSPSGNEPAYTYIDQLNGTDIKITQQKLPQRFYGKVDEELANVAKDFQATNVIQIDEMRVYHGYNERSRVQSLIFVKQDLLVFIACPQKLPDETWASYILDLKKK